MCFCGFGGKKPLTDAPRLLSAPVGGAGVPAGQHADALQPVTAQTGEEGLPSRVEPANRHVAVGRPPRETAAQRESYNTADKSEQVPVTLSRIRRTGLNGSH